MINETLTNLEFTIEIPSVSIDSLSNRFLTYRGRSGVKNSTRNSPLISETDEYKNMAQQRIMGCARETNQIMGKTVFLSYKTEKMSFRKTKRKEKEDTIK